MSLVSRWNDLANECYWQLATPVPGRKPGDLGSMQATADDVIALVAKRLREDHGLDAEQAQSEAEDAVWNAE